MEKPPLTPEQVEARARDVGLSMAEVCRRANVNPATWQRWKHGFSRGGDTTLGTYWSLVNAINMEAASRAQADEAA